VILSSLLFGFSFAPSKGEDAYTHTIQFETSFGTKQVELSYSIPYSKFEYYHNAPHLPAVQNGEMHFSYYVVTDSIVSELTNTFRSMATGDEDLADTVLSFTRHVALLLSPEEIEKNESYVVKNTLYPIETLVLGGVCDDLSVLYATIMRSLGYRLIFVHYPRHLSVGVHLASPPSHYTSGECVYFDVNGTRYYAAETTGMGHIGDGHWSPDGFEQVIAYDYIHKYPTSITCYSNLTGFGQLNLTAELGESVQISGWILSGKTLNYPVPVRLTFVFPGEVDLTKTLETGSRWRVPWLAGVPEKIASDLPVDQYEVLFVPDRAGKWFVYASWDGDDYMEGATSDTISFIITSPESWPVLKVYANRNGVPLICSFETTPISIVLSTSTTAPEVIPLRSGTTIWLQAGIQTMDTTRYVFDRWGDGDRSNPRKITVFGDISLTLIIKTQYYLSLKNNLAGSVQTDSNEGWYDAGSTLTITSDRFDGYQFKSWTVNGEHREGDQLTIVMDKPYVVILNYEPSLASTPSTPQQSPRCLIATATYASELSPEVQFLREFRDQEVMRTFAGREFMTVFDVWYYSFSPSIAKTIAHSPLIQAIFKMFFYPLIRILHLSAATYSAFSFSPELAVVTAGLVASTLIGAVYFSPFVLLLLSVQWKRKHALTMHHRQPLAITWIGSLVSIVLGEILSLPNLLMLGSTAFVLATLSLSALAVGTRIFQVLKHWTSQTLNSKRIT